MPAVSTGVGQQRATAYVRSLLHQARNETPLRLPRIAELARGAGVSYVTMWKAVRRLSAQGVLEARRRWGVWASSPQPAVRPPAAPVPRRPGETLAQGIARRLQVDVASGMYRGGEPLPSVKELAATLGVCRRTVRAALRLAAAEGTVARDRRQWLAPLPGLRSSHLRLLIFAKPWRPDPMLPPASYSQQVHHQMEAECGRRGIALTMVEADADGALSEEGRRLVTPRLLATGEALAGCVVLSDGLTPDGLATLLSHLRPIATPVAVLANTDEVSAVEQTIAGLARVRLFTVGNDLAAGRQVGDYLIRLGHRRVAYLCLFHHKRWSQERLAGLRHAFDGLRPEPQVHSFLSVEGDHEPQLGRNARNQLGRALRIPSVSSAGSGGSRFGRDAIRRVEEGLLAEHRRGLGRKLVQQALRKRDVTAWVAGNDLTALVCLDHLAERGVRPPKALSLAAFDDTYAMSVRRVSTYHFDVAATARAILGFALGEARRRGQRSTGTQPPVEPEGRVIARESVAAVLVPDGPRQPALPPLTRGQPG